MITRAYPTDLSSVPTFSVVMAAYNRGRHILPSIRSVLAQSLQDFELLVIGDACTDDTAETVASVGSPKIKWFNLPERGGSQSFPNNEGIARAVGRHIAYLGHDDVWAPNHLSALAECFESDPTADFAVSGTIYHGPRASSFRLVTGIFDDSRAASEHFFPPSSLAHKVDVVDRIGKWRAPADIVPPVDAEFQLRAAGAGMRFASTQRMTVHKFAAGHRYLYYLKQASDEQARMLRRMSSPGYAGYVASELAKSKASGTFMTARFPSFDNYSKGQLAELNGRNRGVVRPELKPLLGPEIIRQDNHARALDWLPNAGDGEWIRWVGCNPRPKLLVPFKASEPVAVRLSLWHRDPEALKSLRLSVDGVPTETRIGRLRRRGNLWRAKASFEAQLKPNDYTVLELRLNKLQRPTAQRPGLGVAKIEITPSRWSGLLGRLARLVASIGTAR